MTSYRQVDSVFMELCNEFPKLVLGINLNSFSEHRRAQKLLDLFQSVDPRILKAVAFENHTDYDAAFLVVVDEIFPYIPEVTNSINVGQKDLRSQPIARAEVNAEQKVAREADSTISCDDVLVPKHVGTSTAPMPELNAQFFLQEVSKINNTDQLISFCKGLANHLNIVPEKISHFTSLHEDLEGKFMLANLHGDNGHSSLLAEKLVPLTETNGFPAFVSRVLEEPNKNLVFVNEIGSVEAIDSASEPEYGPCMAVSEVEQEDLIGVSDSELQQDNSDMHWFDVKNEITGNGIVFLPSQTKKIELLELSIKETKTIKQTLYSSLEAVRNTLRKVEEREKAAEKAKQEASEGGQEILSRAEELKTMLRKAKEDNDMHAGELYGERSTLATEAMELQSRLANMTEERNKALCILDEMDHSLELRLSAADEEITKAKEEKLSKENYAKTYFNEQEAITDKIGQEAKILELEVVENSKLREVLVGRGRAVDILQGEISVICQAVKYLKCKFDKWVPLTVSFSKTAFVASSGSSQRNISSQIPSDQEAPSEPSSPAKQCSEFDDDDWELVE